MDIDNILAKLESTAILPRGLKRYGITFKGDAVRFKDADSYY